MKPVPGFKVRIMARPWQPLGRRPTRTGSLRPNRPSLRYLESMSLPWLARCRFGILQFNHGTMSERVCANELPAPNQYPILVPWGRAAALPGSGRISSSHACFHRHHFAPLQCGSWILATDFTSNNPHITTNTVVATSRQPLGSFGPTWRWCVKGPL
jgi:hypothetical protein